MSDLSLRWFIKGVLSESGVVGTEIQGVYRTPDNVDYQLDRVYLRQRIKPEGTPTIIDINDDGVSLFTYNPQLNGFQDKMWTTCNDTVIEGGSIISLDIDSVSPTICGEDLTVIAEFSVA